MQIVVNKTAIQAGETSNSPNLVDMRDRAFNYGDGCFATMYAHDQQIFLLSLHIERLQRDALRLGIEIEDKHLTDLKHTLQQVLTSLDTSCSAFVIKILLSRGIGGRGYELPINAEPCAYISVHSCVVFQAKPIRPSYQFCVGMANIKLAQQPMLAGIKHLNRLEQILAKKELASKDELDDLLLSDYAHNIIEASAANVFLLIDNVWCTPKLDNAGVAGVMRQALMAFFEQQGMAYKVGEYSAEDLSKAKAAMLTNAVKFIIPISAIKQCGRQNKLLDMSAINDLIPLFYEFVHEYSATNKVTNLQ